VSKTSGFFSSFFSPAASPHPLKFYNAVLGTSIRRVVFPPFPPFLLDVSEERRAKWIDSFFSL